jgi:aspartate kinase
VIERISYVEAAELAWFGAKVLHPRTIAPAVAQRIPVRVLNTHNVASPGTLITEEGDTRNASGPRAVAVKRGVTVVHMTSNTMLGAHGFLARLFAVFEQLEISVDLITTSEVSVSVTIDEKHNLRQLVERLAPVADVEVRESQCIVAIVGRNLMGDSAVGARAFEAMRGIPMSMFSLGTSGLNLSIVIEEKDADRAVRAIHAALFETPVEVPS